jgi:hypothetical protein
MDAFWVASKSVPNLQQSAKPIVPKNAHKHPVKYAPADCSWTFKYIGVPLVVAFHPSIWCSVDQHAVD